MVGGAIYTHISALDTLSKEQRESVVTAASLIPLDFGNYSIIKLKDHKVSFIKSDNWDEANEPDVGDSCCIDLILRSAKIIKARGQIYHHKWMFVKSDYTGFDVEKSKKRSIYYENMLQINSYVRKRMGNKQFWIDLLEKYGLSL